MREYVPNQLVIVIVLVAAGIGYGLACVAGILIAKGVLP
jgi:hypothetical protein